MPPARQIGVFDTRGSGKTPSDYYDKYAKSIIWEFKTLAELSISSSFGYVVLETIIGWSDTSVPIIQRAYDTRQNQEHNIWARKSAQNTWGEWKHVS